ncbi:MAG TPA: hypothetical protein VFS08_01430 [Gemmatimonadaceae bacterium]|nr:hypothetical protein [Gemmatimonadaceae bacterium]
MAESRGIRRRRAGDDGRRRSPAATLVSLLLHGGLAVVIAQALQIPQPFVSFFRHDDDASATERVTYVATPPARTAAPEPEGGGDGRPRARGARPAPSRLVAPAPTSAGAPTAGRGGGQGSGVGELTGPAAGLRPTYTGPIVWQRPESPYAHPVGVAEKLDSLIASDFAAVRDSIAAVAAQRAPGDWTFERNGRTYGIDQRYIHLGRFSLPTAILGFLPLNQQANPTQIDRDRRIGGMMRESREQGLRRAADEDFDDIVRSIRERKERERSERRTRRAARGGAELPAAGAVPTSPPPTR